MPKLLTREQGLNLTWSTITAVGSAIFAVWAFAAPIAKDQLSREIKEQTQPLTDAFYVIVIQNIQNQRNSITAMEFKRDMCAGSPGCWTIRDAQDLQAARDTLTALLSAKANLEKR